MNREIKNLEKSRKTVKNLGLNFGADIIVVLIFLILTPIIFEFIDVELYGIWEILLSFITYLAILNLGVGSAVIKYTSKYYTEKNPIELNKSIHSILVLIIVVGLIGALLIIFLLYPMFIYMFTIPTPDIPIIYTVSIILAFYFFTNSVSAVYGNVLTGFQRFDLLFVFSFFRTVLIFVGSIIVLELGWSLIGLVFIQLLSSILTLFLSIRYIKKIFPEFKIIPRHFDWSNAKKLYTFSAFAFIIDFIMLLLATFDKIYIGLIFSVSLVTFYSIAYKIMDYSFGSIGKIHRVLFPLSSELDSEKNLEKTKELQIRGLKYISILIFPLTLCLILFSRSFVNIWLGIEFEITGQLIILFCASSIFQSLGVLSGSIMLGKGYVKFIALIILILGILTIGNFILLTQFWGIYGIPISFFLFYFLYFIIVFPYTNKKLGISSGKLILQSVIHPLISTLLTAIIGYVLLILYPPQTLVEIGVEIVILLLINFFLLLITRIFNDQDKNLILSYLPFLKFIFKRGK